MNKEELARIDSAKGLIHKIGPPFSEVLDEHVALISTWGGAYSTCYADPGKKGTIYLTETEIKYGNILNLASAIVHESLHLKFQYYGEYPDTEEVLCYEFELQFLKKIPNVDPWLIDNCLKMIRFYGG
jgi:hypothetical protein